MLPARQLEVSLSLLAIILLFAHADSTSSVFLVAATVLSSFIFDTSTHTFEIVHVAAGVFEVRDQISGDEILEVFMPNTASPGILIDLLLHVNITRDVVLFLTKGNTQDLGKISSSRLGQ